jgi:hypothetical protein
VSSLKYFIAYQWNVSSTSPTWKSMFHTNLIFKNLFTNVPLMFKKV